MNLTIKYQLINDFYGCHLEINNIMLTK